MLDESNPDDPFRRTTADVTVVIPFFNSSRSLGRALASVLDQTITPREIIVVDDASLPSEHALAKRLIASVPQARLITLSSNVGPGEARNAGWDAATCAWVAFLDSDDAWHPCKLEFQLDAVEQTGSDPVLVACRYTQLKNFHQLADVSIPARPTVRSITMRDLLTRNQWATPTVLVRRNLPHRFPQGRRYAEDYQLWLLIGGLGEPLVRVESPLVALFKDPYGHSGQSARIWRMVGGEYLAILSAHRAGAFGLPELMTALTILNGRTARRLILLAVRPFQVCRA